MKQIDLKRCSYALGMSLTIEALRNIPEKVSEVYYTSRIRHNEQFELLKNLCERHRIPLIQDDLFIDRYSLKENCYVIGVFERYERKLGDERHILLYGFKDYGSLGTIFRSGVSFDFHDFILVDCDIDYLSPRVVRASMGAVFQSSVSKYKTLEEYLNTCDNPLYGFKNIAVKKLSSLRLPERYTLVFAQDDDMIDEDVCDCYSLKHRGDALSLSALSSIVFNYCFEKRR